MKKTSIAFAAALGLGFAAFAAPASAAPGGAAAAGISTATPASANLVDVGWRRKCRRHPWRCGRRGGADFRLRAPGVNLYIDGDRDRYRHRYYRHHDWDRDRRWKRRWRHWD